MNFEDLADFEDRLDWLGYRPMAANIFGKPFAGAIVVITRDGYNIKMLSKFRSNIDTIETWDRCEFSFEGMSIDDLTYAINYFEEHHFRPSIKYGDFGFAVLERTMEAYLS